jgi:hypothetical protein
MTMRNLDPSDVAYCAELKYVERRKKNEFEESEFIGFSS